MTRLSSYILILAVAMTAQSSSAFSVQPHHATVLSSTTTRSSAVLYATEGDASADDEESSSSEPEAAAAAPPVVPIAIPPPTPQKRLDPLVASVTRMDPNTANSETKNVPFFGEVAVDGGLTVLVPAAVIAVVGFIMSIVVALNSSDTIVNNLTHLSDDVNAAALAKTNVVPDVAGGCRGLCSSQDEQLESMRVVMQGFAKK